MKQSHIFVFPAWKRWMGVAVVLLSLLGLAVVSYTKFEATRGAHAASYVTFYVNNSNVNAKSFGVVNNTLGGSTTCTYNVGVATGRVIGLFGPGNSYTVTGWSSATDCSGAHTSDQTVTPSATETSITFTFPPGAVGD
jgi:hypothetical protein